MMKFKIRSVDMNGYLGRENHPAKSDEGLIVTPVAMSSMFFSPLVSYEDVLQQRSANGGFLLPAAAAYLAGPEDESGETGIETVFTCVTADGRLLDLMDFELEPVTA